jgi:hypothetical protein
MADRLENYIEVPERIRRFYEKHPEGRLVTASFEFVRLENLPETTKVGNNEKDVACNFVIIKALAYRDLEDPYPAVGLAWERIPGRTPYTFESEVMNGETSAWGRAIAALGILEEGESIASANEVRGRREEARDERPATDKQIQWLGPTGRKRKQHSINDDDYAAMLGHIGIEDIDQLQRWMVEPLIAMMETGVVPSSGPDVPADMTGLNPVEINDEADVPWSNS